MHYSGIGFQLYFLGDIMAKSAKKDEVTIYTTSSGVQYVRASEVLSSEAGQEQIAVARELAKEKAEESKEPEPAD